MKPDLLDILQCPLCKGSSLSIRGDIGEFAEIREGYVICERCSHVYPVNQGILNMLAEPNRVVMEEAEGNRLMANTERANLSDEWLLSLPLSHALLRPEKSAEDETADNERLFFEMVIPTQGVVVELGAGVTWTANSLANRGYRVIACDISSEKFVGLSSSDVFMRNSGTHYERILCDMSLTFPIRDSSVDAVIALGAIHHAHNIHFTFRESCRVLKPGGMLGVVEVSRSIFLLKIFDTFGAQEKSQYHRNENRYSLLEYAGFAAQANMTMRVLPAPSTVKKLNTLLEDQGLCNIASAKYKLALIFRPLLRSPAVRSRLLGGSLFELLNLVFGIQFIGLFAKRPTSS